MISCNFSNALIFSHGEIEWYVNSNNISLISSNLGSGSILLLRLKNSIKLILFIIESFDRQSILSFNNLLYSVNSVLFLNRFPTLKVCSWCVLKLFNLFGEDTDVPTMRIFLKTSLSQNSMYFSISHVVQFINSQLPFDLLW